MSTSKTLEAGAQDRKARLAQLRSLKRKQLHDNDSTEDFENTQSVDQVPSKRRSRSRSTTPPVETKYLSGRNYDIETRAPRLGFDNAPSAGKDTLEIQAKSLAEATRRQADEADVDDKPLDLFKIQPKKPNWDLKRELEKKLEVLNVRTDNAIARLVRERIERQKQEEKQKRSQAAKGGTETDLDGDGEAIGIDGATLVEATRELEREQAIASEEPDLDST